MKGVITYLLLLCCCPLFGQEKIEALPTIDVSKIDTAALQQNEELRRKRSYEPNFGEFDTANASAVQLLNAQEFEYDYYVEEVSEKKTTKVQVLLKDALAVSKYSEFFFIEGSDESDTGSEVTFAASCSIISRDGSTRAIDLQDRGTNGSTVAVELPGEDVGVKYYKTAIHELKVGDILEYSYVVTSVGNPKQVYFSDLQYESIFEDEPVLYKEIKVVFITKEDQFFLRERGMNNVRGFIHSKEGTKEVYTWSAKNLPAKTEERFESNVGNRPWLKFQVWNPLNTPSERWPFGVGDVGNSKRAVVASSVTEAKGLTMSDVKDVMLSTILTREFVEHEVEVLVRSRKRYPNLMRATAMTKALVFHEVFQEYYFSEVAGPDQDYISDYVYVAVMARLLRRFQHEPYIMLYMDQELGKLSQLCFYGEMSWLIRPDQDVKFYLKPFTRNGRPFNALGELQGTKFFEVCPFLNFSVYNYDDVHDLVNRHSAQQASQNMYHSMKSLTLDLSNQNIAIRDSSYYTGKFASSERYTALPRYSYVPAPRVKGGKKKKLIAAATNALRGERYYYFRSLYYEAQWRESYEVVTYDTLTTWRNYDILNREMSLTETLEISDLLAPAGNHFIFSAGLLVGKYNKLSAQERERMFGISTDYPYTIKNEIRFAVPEGYKVENLEAFIFDVQTNAGHMVTKAEEVDGEVIISYDRAYNFTNLPRTDWPEVMKIMDAAYAFTQQKLILKKV